MAELPEIVRQRLKQVAGAHPDADLLTAFAENSLLEREREPVLTHLSQCAACREVVSLALPEMQAPPVAAAAAVPGPRFRWPLLRWAALGSAVTVVIAAVLLSFQANMLRSRMAIPAAQQAKAPAPAATPGAGEQIAQNEQADHAAKQVVRPQVATAKRPAASVLSGRGAVGALSRDGPPTAVPVPAGAPAAAEKEKMAASETEVIAPPSAPSGLRKADEQVAAESKLVPSVADKGVVAESGPGPAKMGAKDRRAGATHAEPPPGKTLESTAALTGGFAAKSEAKVQRETSAPSGRAAVVGGPLAAAKTMAAPLRWTISDAGKLQRSADGGKTWRTVEVDKAAFRAVSVVESDIWAGGVQGILYHSADGGREWTRVTPSADGAELRADIVHIEFGDAQRGAIVTATGENWTTQDGGRSWSRR